MKRAAILHSDTTGKAATGIEGFDEITSGDLPRGRTTLLLGGPGSGKTLFALQFLVHGATHMDEPGIFVAIEEASDRIVNNAASFGWDLPKLQKNKLYLLDAQPNPDQVQSGDFDLGGLLAALQAKVEEMGARRVVFDALDIFMALLPDEAARRREMYRLHEWLLRHEVTGIITAKIGGEESSNISPFGFMQFMVDCAVILSHTVVSGVSLRNVRVQKYRGSAFDENEAPFLIRADGLEVTTARRLDQVVANITTERVSSGIERLDTMLGGGFYRGSSVLITGFSGTAKTTLSCAFAQAACIRGENTLFVSFDSDGSEIIRNLASVGIELGQYVANGSLLIVPARSITGSAETYLVRIKLLAKAHGARNVVVDPVSAWSRSEVDSTAHLVADRLIDWAKELGITLVCTRLLDEMSSQSDSNSTLQVSTLADTWIHLSYLVQAGERNRGLSVIKSRGTAHSNQVRELVLSDRGVTLADTYTAGGEVLMGTMRWERERAEGVAKQANEVAAKLTRVRLDAEEADLEVRVSSLQTELVAKRVEKDLLAQTTARRAGELSRDRTRIGELRGADQMREVDTP